MSVYRGYEGAHVNVRFGSKGDIGGLISNARRDALPQILGPRIAAADPRKFQISGGMAFRATKTILLVLTGCWIDHEKSTSARWLALSFGNQNLQFAKGRETLSAAPLKFRSE